MNDCSEHHTRNLLVISTASSPMFPFNAFLTTFPTSSDTGARAEDITFPPLVVPRCLRGRRSSDVDLSIQDMLDIVDAAIQIVTGEEGPLVGRDGQPCSTDLSEEDLLQNDALSGDNEDCLGFPNFPQ